MTMRDLLLEVAQTYDQKAGTGAGVAGQQVLRGVSSRTDLGVLAGWEAAGFGGKGTAASAPWIGVFDPQINKDPKVGLYLAYIFSTDLASVTLTLQQGVTDLSEKIKEKKAFLSHLERQAQRLYGALPPSLAEPWNHRPTFGGGERPESYEAASVVARRYEVLDLPAEEQLQQDLRAAENLLQRVAAADAAWRAAREEDQGAEKVGEPPQNSSTALVVPAPGGFKPRNSSGYVANIAAREQLKSQKHEELIREFGAYIVTRDYTPTNLRIHPKDLILRQSDAAAAADSPEWLVEVKVVRNGDPTAAVREAVGQLREYSYFLYRERRLATPHLLGLFSEDIGIYAAYLEDQGIAAIWRDGDGWGGTSTAAAWGMVD
ncbi:MrcB family domain-containing protein [Streptomyces sp. NPDC056387]|uniref:MrcB family domain-containing protein n=1 Tax=Streptomyces sp. NPDC056387 TaxID=3345803 RepID=UPI0035D697A2